MSLVPPHLLTICLLTGNVFSDADTEMSDSGSDRADGALVVAGGATANVDTVPEDADVVMADVALAKFCRTCQQLFDTHKDYHYRTVHQQIKNVVWPDGGSSTLTRSADTGAFHCPRCNYSKADPDALTVRAEVV